MLVIYLAHLLVLFVLLPPSLLWWRESLVWVVAMSHWALLVGAASMVVGNLAEMKADPDIDTTRH
jgi:hypothetical protein